MKKKSFWNRTKAEIKRSPRMTVLYVAIRVSILLVMIAQIFNRDWQNVFLCLLTLILMMIPSFIEKRLYIDIPDTLEVIVLLLIYAAEIMGEIRSYYVYIPIWDSLLHTTTGFLAAAVGFSLVDLINRSRNTAVFLSPLYVCIVAFCFSMTVGVFWELFEFSCDVLIGTDMQKDTVITSINSVFLNPEMNTDVYTIKNISSTAVNGADLGIEGYLDVGIYDTMEDLFVNCIGAFIFSTIGYVYLKKSRHGAFVKRFVPTLMAEKRKESE